ncbi:MAG: hypothetical protein ACNA7H_04585 [Desulfotignum sp.]
MLKIFTALLVAVLAHWSCDRSTPAADGEFQATRKVVMSGLNDPWDLAFAPDGALYVAIDAGEIWRLETAAR